MTKLAGWGRYPVVEGEERLAEDLEQASCGAVLSRGLGRSYGDASLPPAEAGRPVMGTRLADCMLGFDRDSGVLRAEAGFSLAQLNDFFNSRGWATPVSPGTECVTLGGMTASDVHGKNHHVAGCFGEYVRSLRMRVADGTVLDVTEQSHPELFRATIGGMGLTGHILEVEVQLMRTPTPWIWTESEQVGDLDELLAKLREASAMWPMTMAWADSLTRGRHMGRGIVIKGRWAEPDEAPAHPPPRHKRFAVPFDLPSFVLGRWSVRAFNAAYFHKHGRRPRTEIIHPHSFFTPLDVIHDWNRIYGKRGLTQYQVVIPMDDGGAACRRLFDTLTRLGGASFLTVVKDCGPEGKGMLSFPKPGCSVALDVPVRGARTQVLIDSLNEIAIEVGGRIYLAKDALTRPEHLRAMEPRLEAFNAVRLKWDPERRLRSGLSARLLGDELGDEMGDKLGDDR
jgi:decaprenylphospho-beta-D-ribofuranose 2-oxidase